MEKFSVYPAGAQGAALLALRASLACILISRLLPPEASPAPDVILIGIAALLAVGGFVRIAAVCAAFLATSHPFALGLGLGEAAHWLNAGAVAVLGPGAYSLDARLFGRRVIRIDRRTSRSRSDTDG